jgi:hypothetical protein
VENNKLYDLVIYDLNQLSIDSIRADIARCIAQRIVVTVVSSLPKPDLDHRLKKLDIHSACIRRFCEEDLRKSLGLAMASIRVTPKRVCYVGGSPDGVAVAYSMGIGFVKQAHQLSSDFVRKRFNVGAGA